MAKKSLLEENTGIEIRKNVVTGQRVVFSVGSLIILASLMYMLLTGQIHEDSRDFMNILLGAFLASFTRIVHFLFPDNTNDLQQTGKK